MPGLAFPEPRQQQGDYRRRSQPPVEKYLHVVPDPRRQLHQIRNDEAQSERQVEKQKLARHEIVFALPQQRRYQERNKEAGVLEPEPEKVFIAAIPTELPGEERAGANGGARGGAQQMPNRQFRMDQEKKKTFPPTAPINE